MKRKSILVVMLAIFAVLGLINSCEVGLGNSVDTLQPNLEISYPETGAVIKNSFVMEGKASDETWIKSIIVKVKNSENGEEVKNYEAVLNGENWKVEINKNQESGYELKDGTYEIQEFDISEFCVNNKFDYINYNGNYDPTEPGIYDMDFYRDGQEYFFIVYEYTYNGTPQTDWTFAQYTEYQLKDIIVEKDGIIEIAVGKLTNTASGDDGVYAMNMDYSLEANQEYNYEVYYLNQLKSEKNSKLLTALAFGAVDLLIVGGIVLYLVKKYKTAQRKADAEIAKTEAETKLAQEQAKQINRICDYCGASVPDGEDMCPACGSRIFKDKE